MKISPAEFAGNVTRIPVLFFSDGHKTQKIKLYSVRALIICLNVKILIHGRVMAMTSKFSPQFLKRTSDCCPKQLWEKRPKQKDGKVYRDYLDVSPEEVLRNLNKVNSVQLDNNQEAEQTQKRCSSFNRRNDFKIQ